MQRLSGIDAGFVYGETPSWHMHAGALFVLDPSTAPGAFDVDRIRALIAARLHLLGPFRHRLVEVPLGLDRPVWVADPDFDVQAHIRAVGVPSPGGPRELGSLVGTLFAIKLDRTRPLWEIWFLEGLEHGHVGLLMKAHHATADGIRGAQLYEVLLDRTPDAPLERSIPTAPETERIPSELELAARALLSIAGTPVRAARTTARLARAGVNMIGFRRSASWNAATFPFQAPRTSLNQPITPHRDFALCSVSLEDVKVVKRAFDVTVNDVVLAICAGALRRYLEQRGELPEVPLIAQVPIGVRDAVPGASGDVQGNRVSVMGASLATQLDDPVERLHAIAESTHSAKAMHRALGDDMIMRLADVAPPAVLAAGVRAYTRLRLAEHHPPIFNLIISNVPGPKIPLYAAGARLVSSYGIGPLLDGGGLNITVFSYCDAVDFGFVVCPEIVDDPWIIADAVPAALEELLRAANRPGKRQKVAP